MRALALFAIVAAGCALPDYDYDGDGWSVAAGDCDDLDPTIHGDAEEVVADDIDQDCDGADTEMRVFGVAHVCDLTPDRVFCRSEQGATLDVPEPRDGATYVEIAAGDFHTCARDDEGYVTCWGDDTYGQSSAPEFDGFVGISAYGNVSLGRREKAVLCWGQCLTRPN